MTMASEHSGLSDRASSPIDPPAPPPPPELLTPPPVAKTFKEFCASTSLHGWQHLNEVRAASAPPDYITQRRRRSGIPSPQKNINEAVSGWRGG